MSLYPCKLRSLPLSTSPGPSKQILVSTDWIFASSLLSYQLEFREKGILLFPSAPWIEGFFKQQNPPKEPSWTRVLDSNHGCTVGVSLLSQCPGLFYAHCAPRLFLKKYGFENLASKCGWQRRCLMLAELKMSPERLDRCVLSVC